MIKIYNYTRINIQRIYLNIIFDPTNWVDQNCLRPVFSSFPSKGGEIRHFLEPFRFDRRACAYASLSRSLFLSLCMYALIISNFSSFRTSLPLSLHRNPNLIPPFSIPSLCFRLRTSSSPSPPPFSYPLMASSKVIAEYAKSGRSSCKKCSKSISAESLRLGLVRKHPRGFDSTSWHHLDCFPVDSESVSLADAIKGFSVLKVHACH